MNIEHHLVRPQGFNFWGVHDEPNSKVLILGHGRHGKDSVGEILRDLLGYTILSSSWFAAERVMMPYFASIGVHYDSVEECYADRHTNNNRAVWYDQISAYNTPDKSRLPREVLEVSDVYIGMRSAAEFEASRHLFDHILWVDASGRGVPPEGRDSMDIDYDPKTMTWIDNSGSMWALPGIVLAAMGQESKRR